MGIAKYSFHFLSSLWNKSRRVLLTLVQGDNRRNISVSHLQIHLGLIHSIEFNT